MTLSLSNVEVYCATHTHTRIVRWWWWCSSWNCCCMLFLFVVYLTMHYLAKVKMNVRFLLSLARSIPFPLPSPPPFCVISRFFLFSFSLLNLIPYNQCNILLYNCHEILKNIYYIYIRSRAANKQTKNS